MNAWLNGDLTESSNVVVPVSSHTVGRGSAIFEVLDIIKTPAGPALFRPSAHIERLVMSAQILDMPLPTTADRLLEGVKRLTRASGLERGCIRIIAYYDQEDFGVLPTNRSVSVAAFVHTVEEAVGKSYDECIRPTTATVSSIRKLSNQAINPHAKVAGHYVNAFYANREAKERGCSQAILLDGRGFVTESATSNLFIVKDGSLVTATTDLVLKGITRDSILRIAKAIGVPYEERDYGPEELVDADEVFVTGSIIRVQPITTIDHRPVGDGTVGPVTLRLMDVIEAVYRGADDRFAGWIERL